MTRLSSLLPACPDPLTRSPNLPCIPGPGNDSRMSMNFPLIISIHHHKCYPWRGRSPSGVIFSRLAFHSLQEDLLEVSFSPFPAICFICFAYFSNLKFYSGISTLLNIIMVIIYLFLFCLSGVCAFPIFPPCSGHFLCPQILPVSPPVPSPSAS